jgi:phospholipase/carboxylesterase
MSGSRSTEAPLGIVSFSGALIPPEGFGPEGLVALPPVCLVHGDLDQVVDPASQPAGGGGAAAAGYEVSYHVSPGTAHGIAPDGLDFATGFMLARLAAAGA